MLDQGEGFGPLANDYGRLRLPRDSVAIQLGAGLSRDTEAVEVEPRATPVILKSYADREAPLSAP